MTEYIPSLNSRKIWQTQCRNSDVIILCNIFLLVVRLFQETRKYSCNLYCKCRVFSLLNKFVYNSHVARCLWLRSVTEGFCPRPAKFSKCPKTFSFDLPFSLINNFQRKKIDALRPSFDWKWISPIYVQGYWEKKHLFDLCMSKI